MDGHAGQGPVGKQCRKPALSQVILYQIKRKIDDSGTIHGKHPLRFVVIDLDTTAHRGGDCLPRWARKRPSISRHKVEDENTPRLGQLARMGELAMAAQE